MELSFHMVKISFDTAYNYFGTSVLNDILVSNIEGINMRHDSIFVYHTAAANSYIVNKLHKKYSKRQKLESKYQKKSLLKRQCSIYNVTGTLLNKYDLSPEDKVGRTLSTCRFSVPVKLTGNFYSVSGSLIDSVNNLNYFRDYITDSKGSVVYGSPVTIKVKSLSGNVPIWSFKRLNSGLLEADTREGNVLIRSVDQDNPFFFHYSGDNLLFVIIDGWRIKRYVISPANMFSGEINKKYNEFLMKSEFENMEQYLKRTSDSNRLNMIEKISYETIQEFGLAVFNAEPEPKITYDSENEIFQVSFTYLPSIYFKVALADAELFGRHFFKAYLTDPVFTFINNQLHIDNIVFSDKIAYSTLKDYTFNIRDSYTFQNTVLHYDIKPIKIRIETIEAGERKVVEKTIQINK
jgi:hypothetical protein